ncbi:MAG: bacteriophage abortive infection AbiH family protein [Candidatus Phocaeicola faecipullorum]|nr:bacteriophage abortive infection AbiH family protein [Candidatus Phocaeicola faecipullorum]
MNRLIILGNGFDIAHGLPTKYNDCLKQTYDPSVGRFPIF